MRPVPSSSAMSALFALGACMCLALWPRSVECRACPAPAESVRELARRAGVVFEGKLQEETPRDASGQVRVKVQRVWRLQAGILPRNSVVSLVWFEGGRCIQLSSGVRYVFFMDATNDTSVFTALFPPVETKRAVRKSVSEVLCQDCVEPKLKQMSSLQLTEGKKAVLKCEVVAGNPVSKIKWYKNDKELKGKNKPKGIKFRKKKQGKISELVIMKVTEADTGAYKCEAINHLGKSSSSANLTISAATSTTPSAKTSSHVTRCGESERNYCVNGGECFTLEVTAGNVRRLCRCPNEFTGDRCQNYVMASFYKHLGIEFMEAEELYQKRVLTITGICIALLVVGIMCVVAYCKTKKQRKKLHDRLRQNLRERNVAAKASGQTPQEHLQLRGHCPKDAVPLEKEAETALSSSPTCPTAAITPSNSQCWRAGKAEAHCPETHVVVVKPVAAGHRTRLNGTGGAHRDRDPAEPVHSLSFAPRVATPPLTPSSPPSESSAPLSSLATSVLSEAVSPSGEEERPLLIQTPVLRAKPGSNQGQKSERSLHLRNSAHYNHGLDAPTPPASPEPAEESGNPSIPPAGQAEPSSESSSSESEEDEDTPFLVLQNPLLASSGSVVLDGLEGRTNPTRSRLNPVMAAADPIAV